MVIQGQPVRGSLGNQSGYAALQALEMMQVSGTLLLEQPQPVATSDVSGDVSGHSDVSSQNVRYWLGLWSNGQHRSFVLGEGLELSASGLDFTFYAHRAVLSSDLTSAENIETGTLSRTESLPQFGSALPYSSAAALRALPSLGAQKLNAHDTDLRALVTRLARERFTGTLALRGQGTQEGVMLFFSGRIGAAFYERKEGTKTDTFWGSNALRATVQLSDQHFAQPVRGGEAGVWLELRALPPLVCASLLGLAREQTEGERSGLEVSAAGYTYYNAGLPYLFVAHAADAPRVEMGFYTPAYSAPSLSLPSEPPGWEEQRYYLTLRARIWPHRTANAHPTRKALERRRRSPFPQRGTQRLEAASGEARG